MNSILVSGLCNVETTLRVDAFPIVYEPVRYPFFGVNTTISGVGFNVATALTKLGNDVHFLSLIGHDLFQPVIEQSLTAVGVATDYVLPHLKQSAQSIILYEPSGQRQIHVDLKDIQEQVYPPEQFDAALRDCDLAVLCNINFNRPLLARARQAGCPIATDVHTIADLEDDYNRDFMAAAHILFMSDEKLPCPPEEWARRLQNRYGTAVIVIGLGAKGALLAVKDAGAGVMARMTAVYSRPVVNTIGAGDALFSAFIHGYRRHSDAAEALRQAMIFASYKIGETGAAQGFLTAEQLQEWVNKTRTA
jgi:acarbose 7IV-phosphotransferase